MYHRSPLRKEKGTFKTVVQGIFPEIRENLNLNLERVHCIPEKGDLEQSTSRYFLVKRQKQTPPTKAPNTKKQ